MKSYIYWFVCPGLYRVARVDDKKPQGKRFEEYEINIRKGDVSCSCKGFYYEKKRCKHIKFLLAQLCEGGGVIDYQHFGDYERLVDSMRKDLTKK